MTRHDPIRVPVDAGFSASVAELGRLVAVPGIAWEAFDQVQLDRSAEAIAALLEGTGVGEVRILRAGAEGRLCGPAVLARKPAAKGCPPCCCMPTMTYSRQAIRSSGPVLPSPPSSGTDGCTDAEWPMTRPES